MVQAQRRSDPRLLEAQIARVQVLEARVLERRVMHPRPRLLLRVIDKVREGQKRDPVIRLIVRQPRAALKLMMHFRTNQRAVEVDHRLQSRRLEVEVMERWVNDCVRHVRAPDVAGVAVISSWVRKASSRAGMSSGVLALPNT